MFRRPRYHFVQGECGNSFHVLATGRRFDFNDLHAFSAELGEYFEKGGAAYGQFCGGLVVGDEVVGLDSHGWAFLREANDGDFAGFAEGLAGER